LFAIVDDDDADDMVPPVFIDGLLLKLAFIDCMVCGSRGRGRGGGSCGTITSGVVAGGGGESLLLLLLLLLPALLNNGVDVLEVEVEAKGMRGPNLLVERLRWNGGGGKLVGFIVGLSVGWNVGDIVGGIVFGGGGGGGGGCCIVVVAGIGVVGARDDAAFVCCCCCCCFFGDDVIVLNGVGLSV